MPSVSHSVEIDAPKQAAWDILADIGGVATWAPTVNHAVTTNDLDTGLGCERECDVSGFGRVTETVHGWDEGNALTIGIDAIGPMKSARSTFDLSEHDGRSTAAMTIRFDTRYGPIGALLGATIMRRKINQQSALGLAGLKQYRNRRPRRNPRRPRPRNPPSRHLRATPRPPAPASSAQRCPAPVSGSRHGTTTAPTAPTPHAGNPAPVPAP